MGVEMKLAEAIHDEVEYLARTVASRYRSAGKYGEAADPNWIEGEINKRANALLALLPQRCAPSEEEIEDILLRVWHSGDQESAVSNGLNAIQKLYIAQPTVREAKAAGWDEGQYACGTAATNPYRSEADYASE